MTWVLHWLSSEAVLVGGHRPHERLPASGCKSYRYDFWFKKKRYLGSTEQTTKKAAEEFERLLRERLKRDAREGCARARERDPEAAGGAALYGLGGGLSDARGQARRAGAHDARGPRRVSPARHPPVLRRAPVGARSARIRPSRASRITTSGSTIR
jgi:hypothetical protein